MVGLGAEHHGILLQPEHRVEDEHVVRVHYNKICIITRLELETGYRYFSNSSTEKKMSMWYVYTTIKILNRETGLNSCSLD